MWGLALFSFSLSDLASVSVSVSVSVSGIALVSCLVPFKVLFSVFGFVSVFVSFVSVSVICFGFSLVMVSVSFLLFFASVSDTCFGFGSVMVSVSVMISGSGSGSVWELQHEKREGRERAREGEGY